MSRPRPPARRKPPVTPDRRHRTPVKVKVRASPRIPVWTWGVAGAAVLAAVVFVAAQAMNSEANRMQGVVHSAANVKNSSPAMSAASRST